MKIKYIINNLHFLSILIFVLALIFTIYFSYNINSKLPWYLEQTNVVDEAGYVKSLNTPKIAIIDSGFNDSYANYIKSSDIVDEYNAIDDSNDVSDELDHGTELTGLLIGNNYECLGVNRNVEVVIIKALDSFGTTDTSTLITAIDYAINSNVNIINLSLGSSTYDSNLENEIELAESYGIIIVASVGNSSGSSFMYPAKYDGVIAIASEDSSGTLASDSNTDLTKKCYCFPGENINVPTFGYDNGIYFSEKSGSSYATIIATGIISLMYEQGITDYASIISILNDSTNYSDNIINFTEIEDSILGKENGNMETFLYAVYMIAFLGSAAMYALRFGAFDKELDNKEEETLFYDKSKEYFKKQIITFLVAMVIDILIFAKLAYGYAFSEIKLLIALVVFCLFIIITLTIVLLRYKDLKKKGFNFKLIKWLKSGAIYVPLIYSILITMLYLLVALNF